MPLKNVNDNNAFFKSTLLKNMIEILIFIPFSIDNFFSHKH